MNEILHANIFFFITGIAVIVCAALACVLLFHAIKACVAFRRILERIEAETENIAEDLESVRAYFSGEGLIRRLISKMMGSAQHTHSDTSRKKQSKSKTELQIKDE